MKYQTFTHITSS